MITRFIIPSALAVAAIALFFSLTAPAWDALTLKQQQKADLDAALVNVEKIKKYQADLLRQKNSIGEENIKRLEKLLPDGKIDNVQLIIDINKQAIKEGNNMALRNIKMRTDEMASGGSLGPKNNKYGTATLNFSVTGPYASLKSFVSNLEQSLRLIDITGLSFTAAEKDSYEYSFEVKTYWLK